MYLILLYIIGYTHLISIVEFITHYSSVKLLSMLSITSINSASKTQQKTLSVCNSDTILALKQRNPYIRVRKVKDII